MEFQTTLSKCSPQPEKCPTLGGKSHFFFSKDDTGTALMVKNSRGTQGRVDQEHWDLVMRRMLDLDERERWMSSRYSPGRHAFNWNECPNQVISILLPAIVRQLEGEGMQV
jgi:hypothetical protein